MKKKKLLLGLGLCSTMLVGTGCSKDEKAVANEEAPIVCTQEDLDELTSLLVAKQKEFEAVSARLTEAEMNVEAKMNDIDELKSERDILLSQIESLQNQVNSLQGEFIWENKNTSNTYYLDESDTWWSNVTLNGGHDYYGDAGITTSEASYRVLVPLSEAGKSSLNTYYIKYIEVNPYNLVLDKVITCDNPIVNFDDFYLKYV